MTSWSSSVVTDAADDIVATAGGNGERRMRGQLPPVTGLDEPSKVFQSEVAVEAGALLSVHWNAHLI